jgi:ABC-2 type transport system permease protein
MSPALKRILAIVLRQLYLMSESLSRVMPLFAWVGIDMVLWGFITRYLNSVSGSGVNFVPVFLGAVLLWDFFTRVMQGVTMAFFEDVWSRNFLNLFATPLSVPEYLAGLVLCSVWSSAVGLVVMMVLATCFFGLSFLTYGLLLIPILATLFLFGITMGVLAAASVLRFGPAAEWFIWPLPAMIAPFAGVFYPVSTLPRWMQLVARLLPPSYVFECLRAVAAHRAISLSQLATGGILAALYIGAACWFFTRIYKRALRTGLIARYSAETVS